MQINALRKVLENFSKQGQTKYAASTRRRHHKEWPNLETNCTQLLLVINVEGLRKNNAQLNGMDYNFPMKWQTKGSTT
jgi:hypothetical protein